MTDRFVQTAHLMAEVCGLPDYRFAVIPHPISSNGDAELRAKAKDAMRQCIELLLVGRPRA